MTKIVINTCYGGFSLSQEACDRFGLKSPFERRIARDDPKLVQIVEEMGSAANGGFAELKVVEIPDDVTWIIQEYDGFEHIAETHRTWE